MFTLICARKNGWVNNVEAGDLRRYLAHYDVIVMDMLFLIYIYTIYAVPPTGSKSALGQVTFNDNIF